MTIRQNGTWYREELVGGTQAGRADSRASATPPPEGKTYAPDKLVDVLHTRIEVSFDLERKAVIGRAVHTVAPITNGLRHVVLDCVELTVDRVSDGADRPLRFEHDGRKLTIHFRDKTKAGEPFDVAVNYHGTPRLGLYFTGPSEHYPDRAVQVWTQGEDEDNRHWFPCFDYPNEKATSETIVTVPESWTVVGNGKLVGVKHDKRDGLKTWHHKESVPHVSYLVSLACGEFAEVRDTWRGIPVQYFAKKRQKASLRRTFARTPDMLECFSKTFGYDYPYEKYSQVVVENFIFGGMENISATTLTDRCLVDERAALDYEPEDLVSHELAHQWFGDLLTCKDWSHAWLNEGFATFAEVVYREHWRGHEDAEYLAMQQAQAYFERDARERRPIVTKAYTLPMELFDQHIYEKGGCVLRMLRHVLGEGLFWDSVREYLHAFAGKNVQTEDLVGVINRVTGRNLEWFFDEWVYGCGYPEFEVSYAWDEKQGAASVTVDQKQKVDDKTPIFRTPVVIRLHGKEAEDFTLEVSKSHQAFMLKPRSKPIFVRFDPGGYILKKLTFKKPTEMLKAQLAKDPDWSGRVEAAKDLCRSGGRDALEAVGKALAADPFWGARAEMAGALGENGSLQAMEILIRNLRTKEHKVRRAVARALGRFQNEAAARALVPLAKRDASYFVEAEACAALGSTKQPSAFDVLTEALARESHADVIRASALTGLSRLMDPRSWPLLKKHAGPGGLWPGRLAAMRALAAMAKGRDPHRQDIREELERYLTDEDYFGKWGALLALDALGEPASAGEVERLRFREADGRLRMNSRDIAQRLREGKTRGEEVGTLRADLEKMREEKRGLEDRIAKLEALSKAPPTKPGQKKKTK